MSTSPPPSWPQACSEQYAPVRVIGTGGFGSVWMAKRRDASTTSSSCRSDDAHVAIKVVGNDTYAQREVKILHALSQSQKQHPNIMRLLQDFPGEDGKDHFIVVSLSRGPTLQYILNKEGGLGFKIAQCIAKQLVSAISFLHGHAVIHRDISPANLIVSGAMLQDPYWWSDDFDIDGKVLALTSKCKITLIDFGFAIALTPEDIEEGMIEVDDKQQSRGRTDIPGRSSMDNSQSRKVLRDLSPLGTRTYAAPEVLRNIQNVIKTSLDSSVRRRQSRRKSISKCTSDYGMVADAYSVGTTICHMVTGIPPDKDADEFLASKNNPVKKFARKIKGRLGGAKAKEKKRTKIYRHPSDLPDEIGEVISMLTLFNTRRRCTVRNARNLPWIKGDDDEEEDDADSSMKSGNPMIFLQV